MLYQWNLGQIKRQSTTEEILISRGFRRESTTEEFLKGRNFNRMQVQIKVTNSSIEKCFL